MRVRTLRSIEVSIEEACCPLFSEEEETREMHHSVLGLQVVNLGTKKFRMKDNQYVTQMAAFQYITKVTVYIPSDV